MLKYDPEVVTALKSQFLAAMSLLHELKSKDMKTLEEDPHLISSAKYNLVVVIESAIDICNHLISKNGFRLPDGYKDSFKVLAEKGVIDKEFALDNLARMAGFRNRLVHHYWDIDSQVIYQILQVNLSDLERFLDEIQGSL
jgi:uncharacterized protein YutE (UPF0331/DUF86 family)